MPIHFVILWSDVLLFILVFCLAIFTVSVARNPQLRSAWRQVFKSNLAIISLVVLFSYLTIGLLDSIHFRYKTNDFELKSVFDAIVSPMGIHLEKTYSSPFSTHLFVKEAVKNTDQSITRIYPPLKFVSSSGSLPQITLIIFASIKALACWLMINLFLLFIFSWRKKISFLELTSQCIHERIYTPVRILSLAILSILLVIFISMELAQHFHVFGTDKVGQDVFYLTLKSIRTGLLVGTITTLVMLPFAIAFGIIAGYFGGWIDDIIQYVYTTLSSIPGILLIAAAVLSLQIFIANHSRFFTTLPERADARLLTLCIILGITSWTSLCRLLRAETLKLRELDYIQAAMTLGTSRTKIIVKHLLPNLMHIILISVVLDFSMLVLAEAVLSYVGVGVDPATISWGNMINSARLELAREPVVWWPLLAAFIFMFFLVLAANLFSDAVRDAFDPRLRS